MKTISPETWIEQCQRTLHSGNEGKAAFEKGFYDGLEHWRGIDPLFLPKDALDALFDIYALGVQEGRVFRKQIMTV